MWKKTFYFSAIISVFLLSFFLMPAEAVEIQGGDSFDDAVELTEGTYEGGELSEEAGEADYYFIELKPGQEASITDKLKPLSETYDTNNDLVIYDEDENEMTSEMDSETITLSWLVNSEQSSYKYYIKVEDTVWGTESYTLKVELTDRYDANSQTDAGDEFSKALNIEPGKYKGYLAYAWWQEQGLDIYDFYKIKAVAGTPLTVTLTPSSDEELGLTIYDSGQKIIEDRYADNAGEILTETLSISKDDTVYLKVNCEYCYDDGIFEYDLEVSGIPEEAAAIVETADTESTAEPTTIPTTTTDVDKTDSEGTNWILIAVIIGMGFLLFVAVIIVIIVLVKKGKKKQGK